MTMAYKSDRSADMAGSKDMGATRELETEGEVSVTPFPVD